MSRRWSDPAPVIITLLGADSAQVRTSQTLTVPAGGWLRENDLFASTGAGFQETADATVRTDTPDCRVCSHASVSDRTTRDPTAVPARR